MTPKEIKILLTVRDLEVTSLAADIGVSKGDLSATINGHRNNPSIRKRFADRLGMSVDELFGEDHQKATERSVA